ncbi:MAG: YraN family protein [Nitrospirae bacterium]|nr:YraN family protein [Nitrospirota bacterium]
MFENLLVGKRGESLALKYLKKVGYRIVVTNYKNRVGEIDLVAKDGEVLVFVEVKTRRNDSFGEPFEAVGYRKKKKIMDTATCYLKELHELPPVRFDVISVTLDGGKSEILHLKDVFEL